MDEIHIHCFEGTLGLLLLLFRFVQWEFYYILDYNTVVLSLS